MEYFNFRGEVQLATLFLWDGSDSDTNLVLTSWTIQIEISPTTLRGTELFNLRDEHDYN